MKQKLKKLISDKENHREFSGAIVFTDHLGNDNVISFRDKVKVEIYGDIDCKDYRLPNQSFIERFGSKKDIDIQDKSRR